MTSSLTRRSRGRSRRASSAHIPVRVAHAVLGVAVGLVWLVLPLTTGPGGSSAPATRAGPVAGVQTSAPRARQDESSGTALVLPLVVAVAAVTFAALGFVRRTRRARSRTTPAAPGAVSAQPPVPSLTGLDEQARTALVQADDCVRTSREELGFAAAAAAGGTEPYSRAVREAEAELAAAFRMRQRYDEGVPPDEPSRRHALAGIIGRCAEAGRRLDAVADGFDRLRAAGPAGGESLRAAEARFRGLAARISAAPAALAATGTGTGARARPGTGSVAGYVEQAKDRLVFATLHLNEAHQAADSGDLARAARRLRAAEGAVAQGEILAGAVHRLAGELDEAAALVPAALSGAEAELAGLRGATASGTGDAIRLARADTVLAAVREDLASGRPYDPLDALRGVVLAVTPLRTGRPGTGVLGAAAVLTARSALACADDYIATHLAAVGSEARTRLAEATRLAGGDGGGGRGRVSAPDAAEALALALAARELAERDVAAYGVPAVGPGGLGAALLGGVLLGEEPDGGPPPSYGGPVTRGRRRASGDDG
ncbi:hypothetical protein [Streptomyces sp. NPDC047000]|uniref:hypothetical protein n=1 Tax=Streptomyces sp. NPDC047000 TaxID=3155474 RepID=UPI0034118249